MTLLRHLLTLLSSLGIMSSSLSPSSPSPFSSSSSPSPASPFPVVINTWAFKNATQTAWDVVTGNGSALDGVEKGCSRCESEQCDGTVGWGGSPDEEGETTLDAMIMDGPSHSAGAVGCLRRIKSAISVARKVLENTEHSLLVGEKATAFALQMGFHEESLTSNKSRDIFNKWRASQCQPNYWLNVTPDPTISCGPYRPLPAASPPSPASRSVSSLVSAGNHDTIGMIVIDTKGRIAAGTSTNGMTHKIPGRVGDSPIPGSGAYVDQEVGGAVGTGDGDVIMRLLPAYQAVENLRQGLGPTEAAQDVMKRLLRKYPRSQAAIVVTNIHGDYGAACVGFPRFPFSVCNSILGKVTVEEVLCLKP